MRTGSKLRGLKSKFSRAARRFRAFFGWRDRDIEAEQEAAALAVAGQRVEKGQIMKMKNGEGNGEDGGGANDSGNDAMPSHKSKHKEDEELDERGDVDDGLYSNGRPSDFAKPPNMSIAEWRRKQQRDRQTREEAEEAAEKQRRVNAFRKQENARKVQDRRNQRQLIARETSASSGANCGQHNSEVRLKVMRDGLAYNVDEGYDMAF